MKVWIYIAVLLSGVSVCAQEIKDEFDDNALGWNEYAWKDSQCLIMNGSLTLESKVEDPILTFCYAPFDVNSDFEFTCEVKTKKIDEEKSFGIIVNYEDDGNYLAFMVSKGLARFERWKEGRLIGSFYDTIKLKERKSKSSTILSLRYEGGTAIFLVNDMKALERRFLHMTSNGIGFKIGGKQKIEYDNLEIKWD